jgi:hypothetical protein
MGNLFLNRLNAISARKAALLSAIVHFHSIHQWLYGPLLGPGLFFSFVILFMQTARLLGREISPSQRPLPTHKIHGLSWIRTHDPSVRASEPSTVVHCDRLVQVHTRQIQLTPGFKVSLNATMCKSRQRKSYEISRRILNGSP